MMNFEPQLWILVDVVIAAALGGVIGYERESVDKPAGLRTQMLIAGASALILSLGRVVVNDLEYTVSDQALGVDPTRIIHAIIVGVSFIGAGTILKSREKMNIKYLTTAATILFSAGIGMSVALKMYLLAVGIALLGLFINSVMHSFK